MKTNRFLLSVFTIAASFLSFAVPRTTHASPFPKPAEAKTRVAIIGLDHDHVWGLLKDLAAEPDAELVGIADAHAELVNRAKSRVPANVKFYSDYIQMLDDAKPDAVIVTTENDLHLAILRECAKRHIHYSTEKPMATNAADTRAVSPRVGRASGAVTKNHRSVRSQRSQRNRRLGIFCQLAVRFPEERRRGDHGFRMLRSGMGAVAQGPPRASSCHGAKTQGRAAQRCGRRLHHRPRLPRRYRGHPGFLELAL